MRILILASVLMLLGAMPAGASMVLILDDQATVGFDVVIIDGQGAGAVSDGGTVSTTADPDGMVNGVVSYSGAAGPTFTVTLDSGLSKPAAGPALIALNRVTVDSSGEGMLDILLTDTGFFSPPAGTPLSIQNDLSGTAGAIVNALGAIGLGDGEGAATNFVSQGPFGPGVFSDTASTNFLSTGSPYSLTESVVVTHTAAQSTVFNKRLAVIPEPGTALLLGGGLLAIATRGRPRRGTTSASTR